MKDMAGKELRTASSRLFLEYFFDLEDTASTFSLRYKLSNSGDRWALNQLLFAHDGYIFPRKDYI